jgi:hypothetical protein
MKLFKRFIFFIFILLLLAISTVFILLTSYKKELASILVDNLKKTYGITLTVEKVNVSFYSNWPNAAVQLENVYLINDLQPNEPLLKANSLSLSFNIQKLLQKQFIVKTIVLKGAEINLIKNQHGFKNFEFKRLDGISETASTIKYEVSEILVKDTKFRFENKQYNKKIEFTLIDDLVKLKNYEDGMSAHFVGNVFVKNLLFKPEKGPFLSNTFVALNLNASICFKRKEIYIHQPSFAEINKQRYNVSAFVELKNSKQLALYIEGKNINYKNAISLLNNGIKKGLSAIKINKPIDAKILMIVKIGKQEDPIIIANISSTKNNITVGNSKIPYSDLSFNASIISLDSSLLKGNALLAKVIIKPIQGKVYDFPFSGSVVITNFINPFIVINTNLFVDAKSVKFKPEKEFDLKGSASAHINYSGPVKLLNHQHFLDTPMVLYAKIKFNNVCYREKTKPYTYNVNGNAILKNNFLKFDNLSLKMDGGNIILKGSVDNFVKYALGYTDGFKAELIATTDYFDLTKYLVKTATVSKIESDKRKELIENKITTTNESNFEFDVSLAATKLIIRKVNTENATINLHYKNKLLDIKSLNVNTCKGKLSAKATIYDLQKIDATVFTDNIDIKQMFEQFENFGQKAIESKNLQGNIFLDAKIKMSLDDKMEVIGNTIDGEVKLKVKDGHLIDYEPLQKISDYIFRNRNFKDITFTEINETFIINGFKMDIKEMELASNVFNFYMSGIYHFKEQSNINILIPWNNLKKRGKNYIPKSSGKTAEDSKGLKLNYSGLPDKLKLSLGNKTF